MPVPPTLDRDLRLFRAQLAAISPDDPRGPKILSTYWRLAEEASALDRWAFCSLLVKTQDEHVDPSVESPFKPFPQHEYLKKLVETWDEVSKRDGNRVLVIHKSRHMTVSWTAIAMVLWSCLFEKGRTIGWQSKKAEDANWMVKRIYGTWERLPAEVRKRHPIEPREGELSMPDRKTTVMGIPEGPDKPRQFTWSLFISDEMAFQDRAEETYVAVQPAIRGGGMYCAISSAAPGFHQQLVEDAA